MGIIWLCLLLGTLSPPTATQLVNTRLGQIQGLQYETTGGDVAEVFLNIPYGKPPVDDLRFEKPVPIEPWSVTRNGTVFGFDCIPHVPEAIVSEYNEDCLTLNIIRPQKETPREGFPVLFFVHGGAYEMGSASLFGYKGFADAYTKKGVIVVTIQYRLGFLGFLSNGESDMPGNLGLWDQTLALKFTYDHISTFGGDPSRITSWGVSAGGAAVGQLALSPHSRDYIFSSIEMSGSPWAQWALGPHVVEHSIQLAKATGCEKDIKACMKTKTTAEFHAAVNVVGRATGGVNNVKWGPRIDGDFFPSSPDQMLKEAKRPIPSLVGVNDKDAGYFTLMNLAPVVHELYPGKENLKSFNRHSLEKYVRKLLTIDDFGDRLEEAIERTMKFYADRGYAGMGDHFFLNRYTEMVSDLLFNVAVVRETISKRDAGWPVYAYSFDHHNDEIWKKYEVHDHVKGSVHGNEYAYVIEGMFLSEKFEMKGADAVVRNVMHNLIVNMARNGVPTIPELDYQTVGEGEKLRYLSVKGKPEMEDAYYYEPYKFWSKMTSLGYDLISANHTIYTL